MLLKVTHDTHYSHASPVSHGLMELRLLPQENAMLRIVDWTVRLEGAREELRFFDQHGNGVILASYARTQQDITVHCSGTVETADTAGVFGDHRMAAPLWYFKRQTTLTRPGAGLRALVKRLEDAGGSNVDRFHALSRLIAGEVSYETGVTAAETTAEEALSLGKGVCQDHAHIMISVARLMGFPARYVSGYLMMNDRIEQEASHAWAEVHIDGLGWVGFDVSNGISPDERYVRVATGLDYSEAAPVRGLHRGPAGNPAGNPAGASDKLLVNIAVQQ
ncbi:MAG: transglutaminase family protein [Nitratireductor sp.]|nr:transglutaminase family protein [Nitratireductor sp.]